MAKFTRPKKSPEQVSAARRAAAMKRHHPERTPEPSTGEDLFATTDGEIPKPTEPANLPGYCSYDQAVGRYVGKLLFSYQDAVQREKAIASELENEELKDKAAVRRKTLRTKEQVDALKLAVAQVINDALKEVIAFAGTLVPPEQGADARAKAEAWATDAARRLSAGIRSIEL